MLTYIIPLRPKHTTKNWALVSTLCFNTLRSCLNGNDPDIRVILCCHELPAGIEAIDDQRLVVLRSATPLPQQSSGQSGMIDKWAKVAQSLVELRKFPTDYLMIVDADDYVSQKIPVFLRKENPKNGCILKHGYHWTHGSQKIRLISNDFNCGTNAILNVNVVHLPKSIEESERQSCIALTAGHTIIEEEMRKAGTPLQELPFPGAIYTLHDGMHSREGVHSPQRHWLKQTGSVIKRSIFSDPNQKSISKELRLEFGLTHS